MRVTFIQNHEVCVVVSGKTPFSDQRASHYFQRTSHSVFEDESACQAELKVPIID
jgi:hypothetical protein